MLTGMCANFLKFGRGDGKVEMRDERGFHFSKARKEKWNSRSSIVEIKILDQLSRSTFGSTSSIKGLHFPPILALIHKIPLLLPTKLPLPDNTTTTTTTTTTTKTYTMSSNTVTYQDSMEEAQMMLEQMLQTSQARQMQDFWAQYEVPPAALAAPTGKLLLYSLLMTFTNSY